MFFEKMKGMSLSQSKLSTFSANLWTALSRSEQLRWQILPAAQRTGMQDIIRIFFTSERPLSKRIRAKHEEDTVLVTHLAFFKYFCNKIATLFK